MTDAVRDLDGIGGLYGPTSEAWRLNREAMLLLGATLRSYLAIVYGTTNEARAEIRRLNELHRAIEGDGYRARDPELSVWVHATLVDTTIVAHDAWVEPLDRDRRARYYRETLPI